MLVVKCAKVSTASAMHVDDNTTPIFPAILVDVVLLLDGVELLNYIATHNSSMPIAMVTLVISQYTN